MQQGNFVQAVPPHTWYTFLTTQSRLIRPVQPARRLSAVHAHVSAGLADSQGGVRAAMQQGSRASGTVSHRDEEGPLQMPISA